MKRLIVILIITLQSVIANGQTSSPEPIERTRSELQLVKKFSDLFSIPPKFRILSSTVSGKLRGTLLVAENKGSTMSLEQSQIIRETKPGSKFHISVEIAEGASNNNKQTLDYKITVLPEKTK